MHLTAEFDPPIVGILVGMAGALLWLVTNWHLVRVGRSLKADIDAKRASTEEFVNGELSALKSSLQEELSGQDFGKLRADLQEELVGVTAKVEEAQEEVRAFYADFAKFSEDMGKDVQGLPGKIGMRVIGDKGTEVAALQRYMEKTEGEDIVPAQNMMEAVASEDPDLIMATAMHKVANYSPSDKWIEDHPLTAMALEAGKPWILAKMGEVLEGSLGKGNTRTAGHDQKRLSSPFGR